MADRLRQRKFHGGQAMVEFAILLVIIMTLLSGMIYINRLLMFDFWAQQEARFLAFEQTWVPSAAHFDPVTTAKDKLENSAFFHRPRLLDRLDRQREAEDAGSVNDLLTMFASRWSSLSEQLRGDKKISEIENLGTDQPVVVANRSSIWHERTDRWWARSRGKLDLVQTAMAAQNFTGRATSGRSIELEVRSRDRKMNHHLPDYQQQLCKGFYELLHKVEFGEKLCGALANRLVHYGYPKGTTEFSSASCASTWEQGFAEHLAVNVDFPEAYRDFGERLSWGEVPQTALSVTVNRVAVNQFYSFFDIAVGAARLASIPQIVADRIDVFDAMKHESIDRMFSDLRYIGSSAALLDITGSIAALLLADPTNHSSNVEKQIEDIINVVLHADVDTGLRQLYLFNPTYLPVPPDMLSFGAGFFSGAMKNLLHHEPGRDTIIADLVTNSNKEVVATYETGNGAFAAATRRFDTSNRELSSKFYLVTQPWHIHRRVNGTGPYREIGDERDDIDEESDEAVLRRRVMGLWLLPSNPGALLDPILQMPELNFLDFLSDILDDISGFAGTIKEWVFENPIEDFTEFLADIPGLGRIVPTLPEFPAVRPGAYPGTEEIEGDRLTTEDRNFEDYLREQRRYNPPAKPKFFDDEM